MKAIIPVAGVVWSENGKVDLFSLLGGTYTSYESDLQFTSDNLTVNDYGELEFGDNPKDLEPAICLVKLHYKPSPEVDQVFDKLWVVVNRSDTQTKFDAWYAQNSDISWTANLPKPFAYLSLSTNAANEVSAEDPEPNPSVTGGYWHPPESKNTYLHHNARFEMRSKPIFGGHGHQAMYDRAGVLIEQPIAAGSADISAPYNSHGKLIWSFDHWNGDVLPYIQALQLDGNPVYPTDYNQNLNRLCIYKGTNTDKYFERRPVLPTGKQ